MSITRIKKGGIIIATVMLMANIASVSASPFDKAPQLPSKQIMPEQNKRPGVIEMSEEEQRASITGLNEETRTNLKNIKMPSVEGMAEVTREVRVVINGKKLQYDKSSNQYELLP